MSLLSPSNNITGALPLSWQTKFGLWGARFYSTNKFGYNGDVGTSYEDIWSPGGNISFLSAADTMDVVSTSTSDTAAGTGARTIRLMGLDGDYNPLTEDVTLNGTTPVTTSGEFLRIYRAYILTTGSGEQNVGNINITDTTGASAQCQIEALRGQSLMAIYTIRSGYYGLITGYDFAVGGTDSAEVELETRSESGARRIRQLANIGSGGESNRAFGPTCSPILVDPKSDIIVQAKKTGAGGTTTVSASFIVWEIRQEEIIV